MDNEKKNRKRLSPTSTTVRELYLFSGNQCAFPDCKSSLLLDDSTWDCQIAHINAVEEKWPRGDHDLSNEELRHASNLLLLCSKHHRVIDNKNLESQYTVEVVQQIKQDHERKYREAIAGLERVIDITDGSGPRYPTNLRASSRFGETHEEIEMSLDYMKPWIDEISRQPPAIRDLLVIFLAHGKQGRGGKSPLKVKATQIEGVVQIDRNELERRVRHLVDDGLLSIEEDEDVTYFELVDPTSHEIGWDLFVELHTLASGDQSIVRRAINELDFSVFDRS